MLTADTWGMITAWPRQGWAPRKSARALDLAPNTGRRARPPATRPPYRRRRALAGDVPARRLFEERRTRGDDGGDDLVTRFLRPLRAAPERLIEATLRCETAPGRLAHVDWGSTWAQIGDRRVRVPRFVMVLGYARRLSAECPADQTLARVLRCHAQAFAWFGGLTEAILDAPPTRGGKRDWDGRVSAWPP